MTPATFIEENLADQNVVSRLKRRVDDARRLGFKVRMEPLDGQQATWCEIAGVPTLFIDLSQTAAEQLRQLNETLVAYGHHRGERSDAAANDRKKESQTGNSGSGESTTSVEIQIEQAA